MIKNIIFDLGNVLLNFDPLKFLLSNIEEKEHIEKFVSKIVGSKIWLQLDRGAISIKNAIKLFHNQYIEEKDLIDFFFDNWMEMFTPIKGNIEILRALKQNGYKIYVLSNFIKESFNFVKKRFDFFSLFDGQVISYEEKVIKPEKAIYDILINRYTLVPNECVFLDDHSICLETAKKLGIRTILVFPNINLKEELRKFNIKI